jgi:hypothetical protein
MFKKHQLSVFAVAISTCAIIAYFLFVHNFTAKSKDQKITVTNDLNKIEHSKLAFDFIEVIKNSRGKSLIEMQIAFEKIERLAQFQYNCQLQARIDFELEENFVQQLIIFYSSNNSLKVLQIESDSRVISDVNIGMLTPNLIIIIRKSKVSLFLLK